MVVMSRQQLGTERGSGRGDRTTVSDRLAGGPPDAVHVGRSTPQTTDNGARSVL